MNAIKRKIAIVGLLVVVIIISLPSIYRAMTFQPKKSDVVYRYGMVENRDKIETLQKKLEKGEEGHVRVVIYYEKTSETYDDRKDEPEGHVIYDINFKYDKKAKQGWLEVKPSLSFRKSADKYKISAMKTAQQCGAIGKDEKHNMYILQECHDAYSYELFPIQN